jgi:predicted transcriptional regulator
VYAVGLGCLVEHASELVYADGMDLDSKRATVPVGVTCRICERMDCPQRAFPPLHSTLAVDENQRGLSFYAPPGAPRPSHEGS